MTDEQRQARRARDRRYYASEKGQANRARKVVRPGVCGFPGCDLDRQQYDTGNYDGYCWIHRYMARSRGALRKARLARDLAWAAVMQGMDRAA